MSFDGSVATHIDLPSLPAGWIWKNLSELVDPNRGICYGIVQPGKHDPIGVPMVNTGDVFDGNVARDIAFKVSTDLHSKFRRSTLRGGELLVTLVGANFGRVAIAPERFKGFNCSRAVGVVPLIEDAKYVMFALRSPLTRHLMDTWANTTAQPTFNLKDLGNLPIPLPPKFEREVIAEAIGAFDDRINLLRETNTTLEAIAQALFKFWFVDFDPVHAKMQGLAPEGIDEATAALFPDSFEDSDLGPVPKGWAMTSFRDSINVIGGGTPKTSVPEFWGGDIPWFSVVDAPNASDVFVVDTEKHITEAGLNGSSTKLLPAGTTIISARGTVGRLALTGCPMAMNQSCYGLRGKAGDQYFTYFSTTRLVEQLKQRAHGSVFDTITQETFAGVSLGYPTNEVIQAFEQLVEPLLMRIRENLIQANSLASLRDALLPRLISGQLLLTIAVEQVNV
jgi:type I restriction enzyme S subunit